MRGRAPGVGAVGEGSPRAGSAATRWIAAAGAFVVSLDSILNIAFPAIAAAFATPPEAMRWVIVAYVATYALLSLAGGALGDAVGHRRVFQIGAVLGVASYLVCGLAPTLGVLIAGRILQGLGGGLVYGTAPGIVTLAAAPAGRGRAVAFFSAAVGLALTLGPLIAGSIVETFGWRSVFLVRVPLGLAVLAGSAALPAGRDIGSHRPVGLDAIARRPVALACALAFI